MSCIHHMKYTLGIEVPPEDMKCTLGNEVPPENMKCTLGNEVPPEDDAAKEDMKSSKADTPKVHRKLLLAV